MHQKIVTAGLLAAMVSAANGREPARTCGSVPVRDREKAGRHGMPAQPFHVQEWASLNDRSQRGPAAPVLDLDAVRTSDVVEEITVYGRRRLREAAVPGEQNTEFRLGSAILSGATSESPAGFRGMTVTAAMPVGGVPGLDAVLNLSAGHDQVTETTTTASAAITAGFRLRF